MIMRLQHQRPDGEIDTYHLKPGRRYHIGRGSACEVRILDLKLSRKHCAVEFSSGAWQIVDLLSTNGCKLDGEQIVGTMPLSQGAEIEAGQTILTVADLGAADGQVASAGADSGDEAADSDHTETTRPEVVQEALPEDGTGRAESEKQDDDSNAWEPEPEQDPLNKTDALIPHAGAAKPARPVSGLVKPPLPPKPAPSPASGARKSTVEPRRPTAVFRSEDLRVDEQDGEKTQLHTPSSPSPALEPLAAGQSAAPAGERPSTDAIAAGDRTFYITVLGRRVGPLTRAAARDLKARELKGSLTTADLEGYPLG